MGDAQREMTFLDHLEELRWVLVRSATAVLVGAVGAFVFHRIIFDAIILAPKSAGFPTNQLLCGLAERFSSPGLCINDQPLELINITMAGQFNTHIMVSLYAGAIVAFPYIMLQVWRFLRPALYTYERRATRGAVFWVSLLFLLGVLFGYYIITPLTVHFLGTYAVSAEVTNQINLRSYVGSVTSVALATGLLFELPMLIVVLTKAGVVTPMFLRRYRRHALVAIMAVAAIITPPDVLSLVLVMLPLWLLFEASILISTRLYKRRLAAESASGSGE